MPYKNIDEKKACQRRSYHKLKEKNRENNRKQRRRYYQANKEKGVVVSRSQASKEKIKEYMKNYKANPINKERLREKAREYNKIFRVNPIIQEKRKEYMKIYQANPLNKKLANIRNKECRLRNQRATREFYEGSPGPDNGNLNGSVLIR